MSKSVSTEATAFNLHSFEGKLVAKLVTAFREISAATVGALELDRELNSILGELTEVLRFEFATVALVDEYPTRDRGIPRKECAVAMDRAFQAVARQ